MRYKKKGGVEDDLVTGWIESPLMDMGQKLREAMSFKLILKISKILLKGSVMCLYPPLVNKKLKVRNILNVFATPKLCSILDNVGGQQMLMNFK